MVLKEYFQNAIYPILRKVVLQSFRLNIANNLENKKVKKKKIVGYDFLSVKVLNIVGFSCGAYI
jgi:hypothetical protein